MAKSPLPNLKALLAAFWHKLVTAVPVILFFMILFFTIVLFFDMRYSMAVPFITIIFELNHRRYLSLPSLFRIVGVSFLMCLCAFFAGLNLALCAILNVAVPFLLVYLQTTQFQQKAYFASAMGFVFLQLDPVGWAGFPTFLAVNCYALALLSAALLLFSHVLRREPDYRPARTGFASLSQALALVARGERSGAEGELIAAQAALHKLTHGQRGLTHVARGEGQMYYMLALLCQRATYFISDYGAQTAEVPEHDAKLLRRMSALLEHTGQGMNTGDNTPYIEEAQALLADVGGGSALLRIFQRNFLNLLIPTLKQMAEPLPAHVWKLPREVHPLLGLRHRLRPDRFEVRFALRLSLVMASGFLFCRITGSEHAYWLPLHTFILLQPMYEDSTYRLKTRLIGTVLGCLMCYLVLPHLPGFPGILVFDAVMICFLHCATPGTWLHPIFTTGFSLSMASLTIGHVPAIELRLFYLLLAMVLVLVVNHLFFPTSLKSQFRDNLRELYHIQSAYLRLLGASAEGEVDHGAVSTALTHFHLVRDQVQDYLNRGMEPLDRAFLQELLNLMWRMAAELELFLFLLRTRQVPPEDCAAAKQFSQRMGARLDLLQSGEPLPAADEPPVAFADEYLGHLAGQYGVHLEALARLTAGLGKRAGAPLEGYYL